MDENLENLIRNISFAVVVFIIFLILFVFVIRNRFGGKESDVLTKLSQKKDMIILVRENECQQCDEIKKILQDYSIYYDTINTSSERYYQTILKKLDLSKNEVKEPAIINVKEGKVVSFIVDINEIDEVKTFIEYNDLDGE